jgi:hypothetical protein
MGSEACVPRSHGHALPPPTHPPTHPSLFPQAFAQETLLRPYARPETVVPIIQRHLTSILSLLQSITLTAGPAGDLSLSPGASTGFKCAMVRSGCHPCPHPTVVAPEGPAAHLPHPPKPRPELSPIP